MWIGKYLALCVSAAVGHDPLDPPQNLDCRACCSGRSTPSGSSPHTLAEHSACSVLIAHSCLCRLSSAGDPGRSGGGASEAARSFRKPPVVTQREVLRLRGDAGSKTGGYQSDKGDEKRAHRRSHHDLTNDRNSCVFRSDGVFGSCGLAPYLVQILWRPIPHVTPPPDRGRKKQKGRENGNSRLVPMSRR